MKPPEPPILPKMLVCAGWLVVDVPKPPNAGVDAVLAPEPKLGVDAPKLKPPFVCGGCPLVPPDIPPKGLFEAGCDDENEDGIADPGVLLLFALRILQGMKSA